MFYGTTFNESKNDWILNNLNFAYQMFNDNFNKEKDLTIQSKQLKTTNVSLNKTIKIIEASIRKSINKEYFITRSEYKFDQDINLYYDDFPNFKSFETFSEIILIVWLIIKYLLDGELAKNHIDTIDLEELQNHIYIVTLLNIQFTLMI